MIYFSFFFAHALTTQLKAAATNKEKENKLAHEASQLASAEMSRALFVRNQANKEIIEAHQENAQLQEQILKVI